MKTLDDLNSHLFKQLERINDDDLSGDKLEQEIKRTASLTSIAESIINNGNLSLKTALVAANNLAEINMPSMLRLPPPQPSKTRPLV